MVSTGSQSRRLLELETPRKVTEQAGGVLLLPPVMEADAWEALAQKSQAQLASQTREGVE